MFNVGSGLGRIQLPPSIPLAGYQARKEVSRGVHDPLYARALAVEFDGRCIAILSLDILYSDVRLTRMIRQSATDAAPAGAASGSASVMVCCSHTHSGPSGIFPDSGSFDPPTIDAILSAAAEAMAQAWAELLPCRLYLGSGQVHGMASRRSDLAGHGATGPMGQRIAVAEFRSLDQGSSGAPRATMRLVSLACHPTVLGPDNPLVSRDWPGFMVDACEHEMRTSGAERAFAVFLNGPAADVSTRYTRRAQTFDEAARLGRLAASGAGQVAAVARLSRTSGVCLACEHVTLHRKEPVGEGHALAAIAAAEAEAERLARFGADEIAIKESRDRAAAWRIVLKRAQNQYRLQAASGATQGEPRGAVVDAEISLARMGDLTLLFCPGELAHETGEDLAEVVVEGQKAAQAGATVTTAAPTETVTTTATTTPVVPSVGTAPDAPNARAARVARDDVWVVGYSNGHLGYLAPEQAAPDAYERVMSSITPESIHEIMQAAMRLSSKGMCMDLC